MNCPFGYGAVGLKYPSVPVCHWARMPFYGILKWTVLKSRTSVVPCIAGLYEEYQYFKARGTSSPIRLRVEEGGLTKQRGGDHPTSAVIQTFVNGSGARTGRSLVWFVMADMSLPE